MGQIVHRDQMDDVQTHLLNSCRSDFGSAAAVAHFTRLVYQQVFAARSGKGIHAKDFAVGIERCKFVTGHTPGLKCPGQAGGKADIQQILSGIQRFAEYAQEGVELGLCRARQLALAKQVVELVERDGLPTVLFYGAFVNGKRKGYAFDVILFEIVGGFVDG